MGLLNVDTTRTLLGYLLICRMLITCQTHYQAIDGDVLTVSYKINIDA